MNEDILTFGERRDYNWKHIEIDYHTAVPILLNDVEVGAFLIDHNELPGGIKVVEMHGIEIYPEYRMKGIAYAVIKMLLEQCDMMIGAITEDQPKPFWLYMKAQFRPIPLDAFGHTIDTVHTEEPVFFFITNNDQAKLYAEKYAIEVPNIMREFNSASPEKQREMLKRIK